MPQRGTGATVNEPYVGECGGSPNSLSCTTRGYWSRLLDIVAFILRLGLVTIFKMGCPERCGEAWDPTGSCRWQAGYSEGRNCHHDQPSAASGVCVVTRFLSKDANALRNQIASKSYIILALWSVQ